VVATGSWDKTVRLWKLKSTSLPRFSEHEDRVYSVSFSPDGKFLATGSRDQTIKIWNRQGSLQNSWQAHQAGLYDVAFAKGNTMLVSASHDCTVKLWERSGKAIATLSDPSLAQKSDLPSNCVQPAAHADRVYEVALDPKGQFIATASRDQTVKIWTMQGKLLHTLTAHEARVNSVAFSPDGKLLASAGDDQKMILWNRHGEKVRVVTSTRDDFGHQSYITDVTFSPDGTLLASAGWDNTVKLWRVIPQETAGEQSAGARHEVASKSNTNPLLVDTLYRGYNDSVNGVAFRPDGKAIASANWDGTVKLWSRDGRLLKGLHGHKSGVLDLSFSPDGKTLVSAGADSTAILWNLDLQDLLQKSCRWVRDYLATNPNLSQSDRALCDEINNQSQSFDSVQDKQNSQNHG
jgi:WD40 repeat protein